MFSMAAGWDAIADTCLQFAAFLYYVCLGVIVGKLYII